MALTRRSLLTTAAGAAGTALAATACGAGPGGAPDLEAAAHGPAGPATLRWWSFAMATHEGGDLRTDLIRAFRELHPDIEVEIVNAPAVTDISRTVLSTALVSGAATPDVYMGDVAWPGQFAYNALATPLSPVVPGDYWRAYPEEVITALSWEGDVYAFPFFGDQAFLFYRADLLERHRIEVPRTWEEVAEAAARVRRAGGAETGLVLQGAAYEGLTANVAEFVADAGGGILDADGTEVTFGGRAGERALGWLAGAAESGVLPRAAATFREQEATDAFTGGGALFLRNWSYVWGVVDAPDSPVRGRVGVAVRPGFEGGPARGHGCLGGWCNFVNPHGRNLGAAVAFARFCAEEEAQALMMRTSAYLPALTSLRESAEARASRTPTLALAGEVRLVPRPTQTPRYPQVSKAIYTRVNTVLNGRTAPGDALAAARSEIADALAGRSL
ncbi:extracellular solute-binding protein [Streptomyces sp. DSM 44917]|uniref:Extracellular solute-binding protein n=1 Tax=Streptomyces boetiae TaxID=3075541 RepID=A0ABU2LD00_9ACTN|nr:extracellular solute-binding protein [Streptomyces sp. DSM 44917]MDT0309356.1 extracellular solute-binding protein [Streptomyces sp. DSM 44917]